MKLIVACQKNDCGIGYAGTLPWHIPEELKFFKAVTYGQTIVMGKKCWDSLPFPLPGRKNLVLTHSDLENKISSLAEAPNDAIVIGGAQIYELALKENLINSAIVSFVNVQYICDTFFPIDMLKDWEKEKIFENSVFSSFLYIRRT